MSPAAGVGVGKLARTSFSGREIQHFSFPNLTLARSQTQWNTSRLTLSGLARSFLLAYLENIELMNLDE